MREQIPAMAAGPEVPAITLPNDTDDGFAISGRPHAWLAVPVARDLLVAAWMIEGLAEVDAETLARWSDAEVWERAVQNLLAHGALAVRREVAAQRFSDAYRHARPALASYFALVSLRIDEAFASVRDGNDRPGRAAS
ncbi:MAG: hypothetical protein ACRCYU_09035 [Nocardioides sp.]